MGNFPCQPSRILATSEQAQEGMGGVHSSLPAPNDRPVNLARMLDPRQKRLLRSPANQNTIPDRGLVACPTFPCKPHASWRESHTPSPTHHFVAEGTSSPQGRCTQTLGLPQVHQQASRVLTYPRILPSCPTFKTLKELLRLLGGPGFLIGMNTGANNVVPLFWPGHWMVLGNATVPVKSFFLHPWCLIPGILKTFVQPQISHRLSVHRCPHHKSYHLPRF